MGLMCYLFACGIHLDRRALRGIHLFAFGEEIV